MIRVIGFWVVWCIEISFLCCAHLEELYFRDSVVEDTTKPIELNPTPGNPGETTADSEKSSDFLRSFYFNHFLNNFQNLNETIKRLGRRSESSDIPTSASSSPDTGVRLTSGIQSEDEDEVEDGADLVFTDCMADLCESECRLCGKRMTIKSLRKLKNSYLQIFHSVKTEFKNHHNGGLKWNNWKYYNLQLSRTCIKSNLIKIEIKILNVEKGACKIAPLW